MLAKKYHNQPQVIGHDQPLMKDIYKARIFHNQLNSIQNYFSFIDHLFGQSKNRNKIQKKLKEYQQINMQTWHSKIDNKYQESNHLQTKSNVSKNKIKSFSSNKKIQGVNTNWKQGILRRKNNGVYGEIFKGNAKDKFSSLIYKANTTQLNELSKQSFQISSLSIETPKKGKQISSKAKRQFYRFNDKSRLNRTWTAKKNPIYSDHEFIRSNTSQVKQRSRLITLF